MNETSQGVGVPCAVHQPDTSGSLCLRCGAALSKYSPTIQYAIEAHLDAALPPRGDDQ